MKELTLNDAFKALEDIECESIKYIPNTKKKKLDEKLSNEKLKEKYNYTEEELSNIVDKINKSLRDNDVNGSIEDYYVTDGNSYTVECEINWGDWKHDHLFGDRIIRDSVGNLGFIVRDIDEEVTEEDGSDCYSSTHYITFYKPEKDVDEKEHSFTIENESRKCKDDKSLKEEKIEEIEDKTKKEVEIKECDKVVEEAVEVLEPEFDTRKSFYGKAYVDEKDDGTKVLYSYDTPVCKIKDNKVELVVASTPMSRGYRVAVWKYSPTTLRHVKEFLKQNGFKADSIKQMETDYITEKIDNKKVMNLITESTSININDVKDLEKGKEILKDNENEDEEITQIVDVDATTVDELKDSYIGNVILQCPICRTLLYKKPDAIEKVDDDGNLYNKEEECPHCGSKEGFDLVGQVATLDVKVEEPIETTGTDIKQIEDEVKIEDEIEEPDKDKTEDEIEIEDEDILKFENFDETKFNKLVNKYYTKINEELSFNTTNAYINKKERKIVIEGNLINKSSESKKSRFIFEYLKKNNNKLIFKGLNEDRKYRLYTNIEDNTLICESMSFKYKKDTLNESKLTIGKVFVR